MFWKLIKRFLEPRTVAKIEIFTGPGSGESTAGNDYIVQVHTCISVSGAHPVVGPVGRQIGLVDLVPKFVVHTTHQHLSVQVVDQMGPFPRGARYLLEELDLRSSVDSPSADGLVLFSSGCASLH